MRGLRETRLSWSSADNAVTHRTARQTSRINHSQFRVNNYRRFQVSQPGLRTRPPNQASEPGLPTNRLAPRPVLGPASSGGPPMCMCQDCGRLPRGHAAGGRSKDIGVTRRMGWSCKRHGCYSRGTRHERALGPALGRRGNSDEPGTVSTILMIRRRPAAVDSRRLFAAQNDQWTEETNDAGSGGRRVSAQVSTYLSRRGLTRGLGLRMDRVELRPVVPTRQKPGMRRAGGG
ncbi:hypothetical protein N657DRAFT_629529 [Parathielavia appendiculata]|uniref:Uncharacterized protein n=1 Tax=Parathielavia appendiculata TaxID=2587402 RepID=A0AAN6U8H2_9PEZI|nr:hypothetical protein N657DRAFT_629529 [Parathielavia appendiculata]